MERTILVVDDEAIVRRSVCRVFEDTEFQVEAAHLDEHVAAAAVLAASAEQLKTPLVVRECAGGVSPGGVHATPLPGRLAVPAQVAVRPDQLPHTVQRRFCLVGTPQGHTNTGQAQEQPRLQAGGHVVIQVDP